MVVVVLDGSGDGQRQGHSRRQGQREVDADSRRNKQIKTMAVAVVAAGGNSGRICVMAAIDDCGNG